MAFEGLRKAFKGFQRSVKFLNGFHNMELALKRVTKTGVCPAIKNIVRLGQASQWQL